MTLFDYHNINFVKLDKSDRLGLGDCIIYCDIPYKNTGKYIESLNHNEFYKWCFEKKEQGYNVFVSEYDMPLDFKCIFEKEHIKKIGVQNNLKSIERLYIL